MLRLTSLTGGYLVGFVAAAGLTGWLARRGWDRTFRSSIGAMLLGSIVIYAFGVPWLYHALPPTIDGNPVTLDTALSFGLYPFIIGDTREAARGRGSAPGGVAAPAAAQQRLRRRPSGGRRSGGRGGP